MSKYVDENFLHDQFEQKGPINDETSFTNGA